MRAKSFAKNQAVGKKKNVSKKLKRGGWLDERRIDGKNGRLGVPTGLKKGGHDRGTSPYQLPRQVPPPGQWRTIS